MNQNDGMSTYYFSPDGSLHFAGIEGRYTIDDDRVLVNFDFDADWEGHDYIYVQNKLAVAMSVVNGEYETWGVISHRSLEDFESLVIDQDKVDWHFMLDTPTPGMAVNLQKFSLSLTSDNKAVLTSEDGTSFESSWEQDESKPDILDQSYQAVYFQRY